MKDQLIKHLDRLHLNLLDCHGRFLTALIEGKKSGELDNNAAENLEQIQNSISYLVDRIFELKESISLRVYCIQVTTTVDTNIKVLAKNEDDAIEWACETADKRIRLTLAREHDVYYDSTGEVLGHKSQADDDADEEYQYDE